LGIGLKKTLHSAEQNRLDIRNKREQWRSLQAVTDSTKLVFPDESGVNTGMTRLYGRGLNGDRVEDYVTDVRFERTSILSSVRLSGDLVPCVFEGALNGELFKEYISKCLAPMFHEGDIVIMGNLTFHKVKGVSEAILAVGADIIYLPPYSPDLNPVEMMWSKIKTHLRKVKARTKQALNAAIVEAFNLVSPTDIAGWFVKDVYSIQ
jgi:transposase